MQIASAAVTEVVDEAWFLRLNIPASLVGILINRCATLLSNLGDATQVILTEKGVSNERLDRLDLGRDLHNQ